MKFELRNDYCSWPANSYFQILRHPSGNLSKSIELAIFNEHRFAFYYWIRWNLNYQTSISKKNHFSFSYPYSNYNYYFTVLQSFCNRISRFYVYENKLKDGALPHPTR
jgi:hypothetical protein